MSTSQVPDPPVRAQVKLPLWDCVCRPDKAAFTMFSWPLYVRFGFPLMVRTPSRVSNAQLVSVLVAFASSVRLCATRSPVPTTLPAMTTCPPRGHCLVTVNVVLIGKGAVTTDAADPLPSTPIQKEAEGPKSVALSVDTLSMSAAS